MTGYGAITKNGQLTMNFGSVTSNSAGFNSGSRYFDQTYYAGGITNFGVASLTGVSISNNTGGDDGGGVYNGGQRHADDDRWLDHWQCTRRGAMVNVCDGGGLYNDGAATLNGVTVSNNSAFEGNGIYNSGSITLKSMLSPPTINRTLFTTPIKVVVCTTRGRPS